MKKRTGVFNNMTNELVFRQRKSNLMIFVFFTAVFSFPLLFLLKEGITENVLILSPFSSVGLLLIIFNLRWKITIKDKQITFRPSFGKTKSFTISDITKVKYGIVFWGKGRVEYIKAYHENKKLLYVTQACTDYDVLVSLLEKEGVHFEIGGYSYFP